MQELKLDKVKVSQTKETNILQGEVDGKKLFFKAPASFNFKVSANPFLAAMLIPAMQRSADIVIPDEFPVSAKLLQGIDELQSILGFWYPELKRISIKTNRTDTSVSSNNKTGVGCLFSGGLDACYSLIKHADEITKLIYVRGIDLQLENEEVFGVVSKLNNEIAASMGKELVIVESNIRFFMRELEQQPLSWYINQAGGLASISLAMGLPRIFVSSSNSYDALHPLGSHPLSDPMWSTEDTTVIHTGCDKRRHEKLEEIAKHDAILQRIRVCWHDSDFNCGVCDKCVHYRVALTIMGLEVDTMPQLENYKNLFSAHVNTDGEYVEWKDNLMLAEKYGIKDAAKAVSKLLNRYKVKKAFKLLDEALTGNRLLSFKSRLCRRRV